MPAELTQLGISGLTLGILFFIVKYFVAALTTKDTYIENNNLRTTTLIKDFQAHIELCNTNFLKNSALTTKALDLLTKTISQNTSALNKQTPKVIDNTSASVKNTEAVDKSTDVVKNGG